MFGILILQKRYDYQSFPINIFPSIILQTTRFSAISKYRRDIFNFQIFSWIKIIIQQFVENEMDETQAKIKLLTLS